MEKLLEQLVRMAGEFAPYLQLDFAASVALHQTIPLGLAIAMIAFGLLACTFGHHPLVFRLLLSPLVAAIGWRLGPSLAPSLHLASRVAGYAGAGLLTAVALAFPPAILFAGLGLGGALVGGELAGRSGYWAGFAGGFLLLGLVGIAAQRFFTIVISALAGAVIFMLGTLSVLSITSLGALAAAYPSVDAAAAGGLALLSMVFQFRFGKTDEDRERERHARSGRLRVAHETRARTRRLSHYEGKKVAGL
jgi:hypothetical protein